MTRTIQDLNDGRYKITEETGEVHFTCPERPMENGYRLFQYVVYPILTQYDIDHTQLPHFYVENYETEPHESETLLPYLRHSLTLTGCVIAERVCRIKIANHLKTISTTEDN